MNGFDVLAVVGAVTGTASSLAGIYSVRRDRAALSVNFGVRTAIGAPPETWITVLNHGRQPITIREAGFYGSEMPVVIKRQEDGRELFGTATFQCRLITEPRLLDPGAQCEGTTVLPDSVENNYHADFPLRAYVIDARGRRVWGEAAPIVRIAVGEMACPPSVPSYLWEPTNVPLSPARVEPWWKLWTKLELRRGSRGRPSADELKVLTNSPVRAEGQSAPRDRRSI